MSSYMPCTQDILYAYKINKPVVADYYFLFRNVCFLGLIPYFKLQHFFRYENSTIFFMVASSEYDQVVFKENSTVLSLRLFKSTIHTRFFRKHTIILFFNKNLLAEKVKTVDIRKNFPKFKGDPHSLEEVQEFLLHSFRQVIESSPENEGRPLYHHFTTAVDTEKIRFVFDSVKDIIMQKNLKKVKFL